MNYGHFLLTLANGAALGVAGGTSHEWVAWTALASAMVLTLCLVKWMDYSDRRVSAADGAKP